MLEIFNKIDGTYTFPDGTTMTSKEIEDSGSYKEFFIRDCVLTIKDGILTTYEALSELANRYGIDYDTSDDQDPNDILDVVKSKIEDEKRPVVRNGLDVALAAARISAMSFTDAQAVEVPELYDDYEVGHAYKKDDRFTYNGALFKVNQDHTSAEQWVPGSTGTESLYTAITLNEEGYPVWQQPSGAHDAYNTGDIVEYKAKLYKSKIDGNSWAPDVYPAGWELYTEESSTDTETPTEPSTDPSEDGGESETSYPDFVQPTGAHDAYKLGDIVKFNGQLYKSTIDNNVYSPEAYPAGWELYTE